MTTAKEIRVPGPDHPITVTPFSGRVEVRLGDRVIADSTAALELREANYPPVMYIPLADVNDDVLIPSDTQTYCPYKGEAGYYSLRNSENQDAADGVLTDAVWFYAEPYQPVAEIAGHAAFYPDKVQITALST